jgi:hypothetical protein
MQATSPNPHFNRFLTKSEPHQLSPPHHPMLPLRKRSDASVISASPRKPLWGNG